MVNDPGKKTWRTLRIAAMKNVRSADANTRLFPLAGDG